MRTTASTHRGGKVAGIIAAAGLAFASLVAFPAAAHAAPITVNDSGDGVGVGTIRYAAANIGVGETINITVPLSPASTVLFPRGVVIQGNNNNVTRGAVGNFPIFEFDTAVANEDVVINNLNFDGSTGTGSAIFVDTATNFRDVTLTNVHIQDFTAARGAGVDIAGLAQHLYVYDSEFINNHATAGAGGAIYGDMSQSGAELYRTEIDGNTASTFGGGLAFEHHVALTSFIFEDLTVTDNVAQSDAGGGIFVDATSRVSITRGSYLRNTAQNAGGAAYFWKSYTATITGPVTFAENQSTGNGGGAVGLSEVHFGFDIDGATFTNNTAASRGGALTVADVLDTDSTLKNSTFESNTAADGGAISFENARTVISENVDLLTNHAIAGNGGGLYIESFSGFIDWGFSRFIGNTAVGAVAGDGNGGAVAIANFNGSLDLVDSVIRGNTASGGGGVGYGGGLYIASATEAGSLDVGRAEFSGNTLVPGPGGDGASIAFLDMGDSYVRMSDNTYAENISPAGTAEIFYGNVGTGFVSDLYSQTILGSVGIEAGTNDGDIDVVDTAIDTESHPVVIGAGNPIAFSSSAFSGPPAGIILDDGTNFYSIADFKFGPLQDNGGFTLSKLPLAGSILIDNGHIGGGESYDQRGAGFERILNGRIDIGAVESPAPASASGPALAPTGLGLDPLMPLFAGTLLLAGLGVLLLTRQTRNRS